MKLKRKQLIVFQSQSDKIIRKWTMAVYPYCFWCGVKVVEHSFVYVGNQQPSRKGIPKNTAIIDHLIPRKAKRHRVANDTPKVLSCSECDEKRSIAEITETDITKLINDERFFKKDVWELRMKEMNYESI